MNTNNNLILKTIGYGVNVLRRESFDGVWERFDSKDTLVEAVEEYNWLANRLDDKNQELIMGVELVQIMENQENGEYEYNSLKHKLREPDIMLFKGYWEMEQRLSGGIVDNFTINDDQNSDGSPINICWLTLGWVSPASNAGYFHFSSKKEFDEELDKVMALSHCDKKATADYLEWVLVDNPHLLNGYRDPNSMLIALLRRGDVEAVKIDYRAKKGK